MLCLHTGYNVLYEKPLTTYVKLGLIGKPLRSCRRWVIFEQDEGLYIRLRSRGYKLRGKLIENLAKFELNASDIAKNTQELRER